MTVSVGGVQKAVSMCLSFRVSDYFLILLCADLCPAVWPPCDGQLPGLSVYSAVSVCRFNEHSDLTVREWV